MTAAKRSPFYAGTYAGSDFEDVDASSRISRAAQFDRKTCKRALRVPRLQKTVRAAIERRIRQLDQQQAAARRRVAVEDKIKPPALRNRIARRLRKIERGQE